ncbi:MAG: hypothetical protein ACOYJQ_18730, partial [Pseudochelatococcus sp.]|uniref:hypothetical protein n=1 Tax=Pseudochelatococcus sp. TaxID=2020869 RepID=UPI003D8DF514
QEQRRLRFSSILQLSKNCDTRKRQTQIIGQISEPTLDRKNKLSTQQITARQNNQTQPKEKPVRRRKTRKPQRRCDPYVG